VDRLAHFSDGVREGRVRRRRHRSAEAHRGRRITALTPSLPAALEAAYRQAHYVVFEPPILIRIGERNAALDELIGRSGSAAFVTAANPGSERRSEAENLRLVEALEASLKASCHRYFEGEGRDAQGAWPAEPSFLVLGIARAEAIQLARRFAQNALVWCEAGKPPELVVAARWRLVLDTHVWLDWLTFDDPSVAMLKAAVAGGRAEIYLDAACAAELERVLGYPIAKHVAPKPVQEARLAQARFLSRAPKRALTGAERASLPRCSDRDDQKLLELALAAQAHALVTRDRALLELARRAPFLIVSPGKLALG
jgi:predicted nucleic acid-binding protein